MPRRTTNMFFKQSLAAHSDLSATQPVKIGPGGYLSIHCVIDNGAGGAPSDTPLGTWELHVSEDGTLFTPFVSDVLAAKLSTLAPNGNVIVDRWVSFRGVPGTEAKLRYKATGGGAGNSRATVNVTVDA